MKIYTCNLLNTDRCNFSPLASPIEGEEFLYTTLKNTHDCSAIKTILLCAKQILYLVVL